MAEEKKHDALEFDMDAFDAQIEKEIDSLFVPVMSDLILEEKPAKAGAKEGEEKRAAPARSSAALEAAPPKSSPAPSSAPQPVSSGRASAPDFTDKADIGGFDLQAFEAQIDSTIDGLFVPSGTAAVTDRGKEEKPPAAEADIPSPGAIGVGPDQELPGADVDAVRETAREPELPELLEALNVAHLSLDWEFSVGNVSMLESALDDLEPYSRGSRETLSAHKMFKAILKYLKARPDSVDKRLIEFIRDAHATLKILLLAGAKPGMAEREVLANLTKRFQAMGKKRTARREDIEAVPTTSTLTVADASIADASIEEFVSPSVCRPPLESVAPSSLPSAEGIEDTRSLEDFKCWMESYGSRLGKILKHFELERDRLLQLTESVAKTPALSPVTVRLRRINAGLGAQISALSRMEQEWSSRLQSAEALEEVTLVLQAETPDSRMASAVAGETVAAAAVPEEPVQVDQFADTVVIMPEKADREEAAAPSWSPSERRRESVYVFEISEKPVAVLAHHVVKIERIPVQKMDAILKRGFAVLDDFKGLFRGIKSGLLGDWANLPKETLKTFLFMPMTHEMLGIPSKIGASKKAAAVLMSNGRQHGIVFSAFSGANMHFESEIDESKAKGEFILGTAEVASGTPMDVLDIDRLLKKLGSEP